MSKNNNSCKNTLSTILQKSKHKIKNIVPADMPLFLFQFIKHPNDIGALTPSSCHLAEAMTRFVGGKTKTGKKYLEAGAGTGAFTKALISKLSPNDHLDLIEINPLFCERLKKKYAGHRNVHIHACSVLDWNPDYKYDAIVSSLPFNAFKPAFVEEIYRHYEKICSSKGYVTYCEYMALPAIKKLFLPSAGRKTLMETRSTICRFQEQYQVKVEKVFANFPPAFVHHCQFP